MKIELTIESKEKGISPSQLINKLIAELQVMPERDRIDGSSAYTRNGIRVSIRRDVFINKTNQYFEPEQAPDEDTIQTKNREDSE